MIVTFDRDFGEIAIRRDRRPAAGVLLLRFVPENADQVSELLIELLGRPGIVWRDHLSVLDGTHLRQRRM
jgi:predicted nuclease of predicted toxin-antitoxin system